MTAITVEVRDGVYTESWERQWKVIGRKENSRHIKIGGRDIKLEKQDIHGLEFKKKKRGSWK